MFNCHGVTFALIICFWKLGLTANPKVVSNPQSIKLRINQPSEIAEHRILATRSKVRIRKVKNVHPKYCSTAEKASNDHPFDLYKDECRALI